MEAGVEVGMGANSDATVSTGAVVAAARVAKGSALRGERMGEALLSKYAASLRSSVLVRCTTFAQVLSSFS
jgi:hypothetical protein